MWNHPLRTIWIGEYMQKDYDDYEDEMMRLAMGMDSEKFPPLPRIILSMEANLLRQINRMRKQTQSFQ